MHFTFMMWPNDINQYQGDIESLGLGNMLGCITTIDRKQSH